LHDLAGEPAGNEANKQYDQQAFARHIHFATSQFEGGSITIRPAAVCIKLTRQTWLLRQICFPLRAQKKEISSAASFLSTVADAAGVIDSRHPRLGRGVAGHARSAAFNQMAPACPRRGLFHYAVN
jgi:hypothetical protein